MTSGGGDFPNPLARQAGHLLHECEHSRVLRLWSRDGPLIRKEFLGPQAAQRLARERAMLVRLAGVPGVVQLASVQPDPGTLLLQDVGGTALAGLTTPLPESELLDMARALARAVAGFHARGVMHRDLSPANVIVTDQGALIVIDFALATTVAEIRPEFTHHNEIVGTLPYLAPEQTGRTGRPVDQRADLYALGAVLYELATGTPPFGTGDPLRLCHDHLARLPVAPERVYPAVRPEFSEIVLRLLEKEPDRRYQTADGLQHDLTQLASGHRVVVGERDFPLRLRPPSRLVGRDADVAALGAAFAGALSGQCRGLLVSGPAGVGKTSLINELRAIVTAADGWYVSGKFDQYRRDQDYDALRQAFRGLGRLLLAEPESALVGLRERILTVVGSNVGLAVAILPEFATLLSVVHDGLDPDLVSNQLRAQQTAIDLLRAVASRKRPVVLVIDDLQWATRTPLGVVDLILSGAAVEGLLLVCAYRGDQIEATHPLAPMLARWVEQGDGVERLHLTNLNPPSHAELVADILRMDPTQVTDVAAAIAPYTNGNPFDTVAILNALRHERLLVPTAQGWRADPVALRRRLASSPDVTEAVLSRVRAMPPPTQAVLEEMACLGGRVELSIVAAATGETTAEVERRLGPALDEGLLVMTAPAAEQQVRFRHDRVRESVLAHIPLDRLGETRLRLARGLARRPELFAAAAEQYVPVRATITEPAERSAVAALFRKAAEQAKLLSNHTVVERLLTAAVPLIDPGDRAVLIEVHKDRHAALYGLGRLTEANEVYAAIQALAADPLTTASATVVQVSSLTNQGRLHEAIELGLRALRQLGRPVPPPDVLGAEIDQGIADAYRWAAAAPDDDRDQPELTDPAQLAVAALTNRLLPPAFFINEQIHHWLCVLAFRIWTQWGVAEAAAGAVRHVSSLLIEKIGAYRAGRDALLRVVAVCEARGYEPATSQAHFAYALDAGPWFEPVEDTVARSRRAREGLIRAGDNQDACYTYYVSVAQSLAYLPTLDSYVTEVEEALAFTIRTGNESAADAYRPYRQLVDVLRGAATPDAIPTETTTGNPTAVANVHVTRALAAAIFGDSAGLERESAAAMRLLRLIGPAYPGLLARLLRALALVDRLPRPAGYAHDGSTLAELDALVDWLAARAHDAPANLVHLLRLVEAERAWATGDFQTAVTAYDAAVREATARDRPWHRAFILERAARFYLAYGADYTGHRFLNEARAAYQAWGATGKVDQLDRRHAHIRDRAPSPDERIQRSHVATGTIDLMGVLAASQALSSETSIGGLHARVVGILSAMTGATRVHLLVRDPDEPDWHVVTGSAEPQRLSGLTHPPVPMAAVRYVERTREPLVVADATRDDRFSRDPYLSEVDSCSLLGVPVVDRGQLQAMLLLENRLIRGAFSAERLDAVTLIARQLAVSLDNAMLYTSLERKVAQCTRELAEANERLEQLSATDPLTGLSNRRRLERVLANAWHKARADATPIAVAMIDIDQFKDYNDHYGHAAGDRALQRIATALHRATRETDLVARYGGEEFAVVMPDTDLRTASAVAHRLHAAIRDLSEPHELAPRGIITVSIGTASITPVAEMAADRLLEAADGRLYEAKRNGRDQIRPPFRAAS